MKYIYLSLAIFFAITAKAQEFFQTDPMETVSGTQSDSLLLTSDQDGTIYYWSTTDKKVLDTTQLKLEYIKGYLNIETDLQYYIYYASTGINQEYWTRDDSLTQKFPVNYMTVSRFYQLDTTHQGMIILQKQMNSSKIFNIRVIENEGRLAFPPLEIQETVTDLIMSPDHWYFAVLYQSGKIEIRRSSDFELYKTYHLSNNQIEKFKWLADGKEFAVLYNADGNTYSNESVVYRQLIEKNEIYRLTHPNAENYFSVKDFAVAEKSGEVACLYSNGNEVIIFDRKNSNPVKHSFFLETRPYVNNTTFLNSLDFNSSGTSLFIGGNKKEKTPILLEWQLNTETVQEFISGSLSELRMVEIKEGISEKDIVYSLGEIDHIPAGKINDYNLPVVDELHTKFAFADYDSIYLGEILNSKKLQLLHKILIPAINPYSGQYSYLPPTINHLYFTKENNIRILTTVEKQYYLLTFSEEIQLIDVKIFPATDDLYLSEEGFLAEEERLLLQNSNKEDLYVVDLKNGLVDIVNKSERQENAYLYTYYDVEELVRQHNFYSAGYKATSHDKLFIVDYEKIVLFNLYKEHIMWQVDHELDINTVHDIIVDTDDQLVYFIASTSAKNEFYFFVVDINAGEIIQKQKFTTKHKKAYLSLEPSVVILDYSENKYKLEKQVLEIGKDLHEKPQLLVQSGNKDHIADCQFSPAGTYFSTYDRNETIIFDSRTGFQILTLQAVLGSENNKFSYDEKYLIQKKDNTLIGHEIPSGKEMVLYAAKGESNAFFSNEQFTIANDQPAVALIVQRDVPVLQIIDYEKDELLYEKKMEKDSYPAPLLLDMNKMELIYRLSDSEDKQELVFLSIRNNKIKVISAPGYVSWIKKYKDQYLIAGDSYNVVYLYDLQKDEWLNLPFHGVVADLDTETGYLYASDITKSLVYNLLDQSIVHQFEEDWNEDLVPLGGKFSGADAMAINTLIDKMIVTQYDKIELWDTNTLSKIREIERNVFPVISHYTRNGSSYLTIKQKFKTPVQLNLSEGKILNNVKDISPYEDSYEFNIYSPDKSSTYYIGHDNGPGLYKYYAESDTGALFIPGCKAFSVSPDEKYMAVDLNGEVVIYLTKDHKEFKRFEGSFPLQFSKENDKIAFLSGNLTVNVADLKLGTINTIKTLKDIEIIGFHPGGEQLMLKHENKIINVPWEGVSSIGNDEHSFYLSDVDVTYISEDKHLICYRSAGYSTAVQVLDLFTGEIKYSLAGHKEEVNDISETDKFIVTSGADGTTRFWNKNNFQEVATIIIYGEQDFLITTPEGYFMSTREGTKSAAFMIGKNVYPFEQFDMQFNRPDIVLERLGYATKASLEIYKKAYEKRISGMGFHFNDDNREFHLPVSQIINKNDLPLSTSDKKIEMEIKAFDEKYELDRINIWINDVPAFGSNGISISNTNSLNKKIELLLSSGRNKIQVSCHNSNGVESMRETVEVYYEPKQERTPNLYLIVISVSDYRDNNYDLKFAAKDGRDLQNLFSALHNTGYNVILEDSLINQDAIRENVLSIKDKLLKSEVDDKVILFVSGHGLLDNNYDWWFATHDMDFNDPSKRGVSYSELESLLDSIPARKKLFLMDACHSGEVDKEEMRQAQQVFADNSGGTLTEQNFKGTGVTTSPKIGLQNSFNLMQELFLDLSRGSGAHVISAAAGNSYAYEYGEYKNGVFTYAIRTGLASGKADLNKDGVINISEISKYVAEEVTRLTNGRQTPTNRQENIDNDFVVWTADKPNK